MPARADAPRGAPPAGPSSPLAFRDVAQAWGLPVFESKRVQAVDLDGDGWPDLVFNTGERVFLNRPAPGGPGRRFVDFTEESGLKPKEGRGATVMAWGDVDNDGDVDCFYGRYCDFAPEKKRKDDDGRRNEIWLNDGK